MPDAEQTRACPHCDSTRFQSRKPGHDNSWIGDDEPRYRCRGCQRCFDRPVERDIKWGAGPKRGLAAVMAREDVRSVDDLQRVLDGGER